MMKASDLLVKCLENEGIEYIFGVPGEENADFMMSLEKSDKIKFILTRHEQGAAFMAEVYGRLKGTPAVCLGTLGPGATNLITGVADANMDRSPMIVLTGQGSTHRLHKESHQIMDVIKMFEPVTKWATSIVNADTIPEIVRKSVRIARSEKPGAVLIELPEDIAKCKTTSVPMSTRRFRRSIPAEHIIDDAVMRIKKAKFPVIIAGNGCVRKRTTEPFRSLVKNTGIGVLNTFMAKGVLIPDQPESLYTIGLGVTDIGSCAIESSDLVICIGIDMVEYQPSLWNSKGNKEIIHIDFIPAEIDQHYHPQIELIGDLADTLTLLDEKIRRSDVYFEPEKRDVIREAIKKELNEHNNAVDIGVIKPQKVLHEVQKIFGKNGLVLSDVGAHKMWVARHYHCEIPNGCLIPNGFCSMGFALPGAIAASIVEPQCNILAIVGDGGFLMNVQEMETASRLNSNITIMVWEDREYGLIAWKQWAEHGRHTDLSFNNPDWKKLAEAFSWHYQFVDESAKLAGALEKSNKYDGPSLIVIPIDYRENKLLTKRLGEITCNI